MIIGLVGQMGSGKGEIVKILEGKGFKYVRLSSMVREEAARRGLSDERKILQDVGNAMRAEGGVGVLARKALETMRGSEQKDLVGDATVDGTVDATVDWVVDGIRNPGEVEELKKAKDFLLLGVHADREILAERILSRAREGDAQTYEDIVQKLDREWGEGEPADGQQVGRCMELADKVLENEGTLDELKGRFTAYYADLRRQRQEDQGRQDQQGQHDHGQRQMKRPSKDEYYLDLAKSVSRRATCLKVEIGAVIIRDDQVVATGYCGAPRGTKSSLEHGFCLRQKLGIPSGHRYEMCRSVHAEQNAIINAARSGTSLLGGDMYIYGERRGVSGGVGGMGDVSVGGVGGVGDVSVGGVGGVGDGMSGGVGGAGDGEGGEVLDAFPCFICKKMLINCGLQRVICSLKEGGFKTFQVEDWMAEWREQDIIDDKHQYGEATVNIGGTQG